MLPLKLANSERLALPMTEVTKESIELSAVLSCWIRRNYVGLGRRLTDSACCSELRCDGRVAGDRHPKESIRSSGGVHTELDVLQKIDEGLGKASA
jgi:hypothetical protein